MGSEMFTKEIAYRKRELEVRLSVYIANEVQRFVDDTGFRVASIEIPIQKIYEFGSLEPHHILDVQVMIEL